MNKNGSIYDYVDYNKRYVITIIILSTLLAIILGIYITREYILKKDTTTNKQNSGLNTYQTPSEETEATEEIIEKDILWTSSANEDGIKYEVYIKNNNLYINEDVIENNIKKYLNVTIGGSVCEGNSYIINLKEDNTIGALSIDKLSCDNIIEYSTMDDLENVTDIYYESHLTEDDTLINNIYANIDDNSIIINDYFTLK